MNGTTIITLIVSIIVAAGGGAGIASLITGRAIARKTGAESAAIDAKLPAEVDSITVQGAEQAVLVMQRTLETVQADNAQLRKDREADRQRITELEDKVRELERKVTHAEDALGDARREAGQVRAELTSFLNDQQHRR